MYEALIFLEGFAGGAIFAALYHIIKEFRKL